MMMSEFSYIIRLVGPKRLETPGPGFPQLPLRIILYLLQEIIFEEDLKWQLLSN